MTATYLIPANIKTTQGELQDTKLWQLSSNPSTLVEGLFWYDTVNHLPKYYNGTSAVEFGKVYTEGTGITISAQNIISVNLSATDIPNLASNKITAMTGYSIASATSAITTSDSLNSAIGKLEYHINHLATSDIPDLSATYLLASLKGANNGVASLDSTGKVPSTQLPSFVDDVIDSYIVSGATALSSGWLSLTDGGSALTPETGKIYVVLTSGAYQNKTYRWSGTTYVEISASPAQATESAAGIAEIATQTEVNTGTDDTRFVTPKKLKSYTLPIKVASHYNPALTPSGGSVTWTISTSLVDIYNVCVRNDSTGEQVFCPTTVTGTGTDSKTITIEMLASANVPASTYRVIAIGF